MQSPVVGSDSVPGIVVGCTTGDTNLEHVLVKHVLILLTELFKDNFTKLREVDVAVPDNVVCQVNNLLLHGVKA